MEEVQLIPHATGKPDVQIADASFVRSEQVRLLYHNAGAALLVNLVNAALLILAMTELLGTRLLYWLTALVAVTLARGLLVRAYRNSPGARTEPEPWARRFVAGSALAGVLWGAAGILIVSEGSMAHQAFAAFILGGMSAGAIVTGASVTSAYLSFILPTLLPVAVLFLASGDRLHLVMGTMVLVFAAALLATGRHAERLVRNLLDLQVRNARINDELSRHREQLEQLVEARTTELAKANRALRERGAELREQSDRLAEADRRKDEFLALLGHELRNPLAAIRNAAELLGHRKPGTDPETAWASGLIERQTERLARLVDDLLDVARISRGKIHLRQEPLELVAPLTDAIEAARPFIDARGHRLQVALPENPLMLRADRVRFAQVVENLLINAAKYTPSGGLIQITAVREVNDAVIRVQDTGVGIETERLEHIFEPFQQGEEADDGLGLGLALVRKLVELHGGRIVANSPGPAGGSEFVVRLPALAEHEVFGSEHPAPKNKAGPAQEHRVLVVDDNADAAESLASLLRVMGQDVRAAYDGESALASVPIFKPDIAILDLGMPGMDGYELAGRLREVFPNAKMRLVALSGHAREADNFRSRDAGFDLHLVKPAGIEDLQKALRG